MNQLVSEIINTGLITSNQLIGNHRVVLVCANCHFYISFFQKTKSPDTSVSRALCSWKEVSDRMNWTMVILVGFG